MHYTTNQTVTIVVVLLLMSWWSSVLEKLSFWIEMAMDTHHHPASCFHSTRDYDGDVVPRLPGKARWYMRKITHLSGSG